MNYYYEALNDQSFEKLVHALIVSAHPEAICLPVRQPDGGRDAFYYHDTVDRKNFVVFQVKFSNNPKDKSERDVISSLIKSEQSKVKELISKGATHYYFVTNVQGTGHLDSGSIDKVNKVLTNTFEIPTFVWWRDDIDSRLDNESDIKWSYPEICRATDVLQFLVHRTEDKDGLEAARAITAYIGKQFGDDRDVKFKQVELKRRITDLFIDIPVGHKASRRERGRAQSETKELRQVEEYLDRLYEFEDFDEDDGYQSIHHGLAACFLLNMPFGKGTSRFVLEGAPGQGKSTVTQFICQINRLKLLPTRRSDLSSVNEIFVKATTRSPFRVDLRDYAAWVSGRHPYAKQGEIAPPEEGQRSLESFLTMQIMWGSGGLTLSQNDLLDFLARAHSIIILDGFDEVADIRSRVRVVEEICAAADRLDAHALSLQIIVTSRPAAFANSPGFPEDDWVHLELNDLKRSNIKAYQIKWAEAQDLTKDEKEALASTLEEKLRQPHLRDLSRNPMQLAILLQLMHVQGAALPDKRTALYEEYMKIFLNREVEKKQILGDHRELILSIHGLLAWVLQVQAETGQGSGSITMEELKVEVANYLASEEHEPDLANSLMAGTVERVGALVSRVQGTFEFEVQPLREYFAARHLHKTAPYSPPRRPKKGTRPDRFTALARNSYWTNVTRFFCGFYDVGELPSLVEELVNIGEEPDYKLITQPRRLALMLLADYVFIQSPKSMRRLIDFIGQDTELQLLTAVDWMHGHRGMRLPEGAGGRQLFDLCARKLQKETDENYRCELRQVMARNGRVDRLKEYFLSARNEESTIRDLFMEVCDFEIADEFTAEEILEITEGNLEVSVRWLAEANLFDHIAANEELYTEAFRAFFDLKFEFEYTRSFRGSRSSVFVVLAELLHPYMLAELFTTSREYRAEFTRREYLRKEMFERRSAISDYDEPKALVDFSQFVRQSMEGHWDHLCESLKPWIEIVNRGFVLAPKGRLFSALAMISTAVSLDSGDEDSSQERAGDDTAIGARELEFVSWSEGGFRPKEGLVQRLYFARKQADNTDWWIEKLEEFNGEEEIILLSVLMCWGERTVLEELSSRIENALEELDNDSWAWLWRLYSLAISAGGSQIERMDENWLGFAQEASKRFAIVMTKRLAENASRRAVARRCFYNYRGGDRRILQTAAEWELFSETEGEVDWNFVLQLSKLARKNGIDILFSHNQVRRSIDVPLDIAVQVLENCENYSSQLVLICEREVGAEVARKARKVSTVADEDEWFSGNTDLYKK